MSSHPSPHYSAQALITCYVSYTLSVSGIFETPIWSPYNYNVNSSRWISLLLMTFSDFTSTWVGPAIKLRTQLIVELMHIINIAWNCANPIIYVLNLMVTGRDELVLNWNLRMEMLSSSRFPVMIEPYSGVLQTSTLPQSDHPLLVNLHNKIQFHYQKWLNCSNKQENCNISPALLLGKVHWWAPSSSKWDLPLSSGN